MKLIACAIGLNLLCMSAFALDTQNPTSPAQDQSQAQAQTQASAEKNKADGEAFLKENKTKPGVVTLPSGLQYKVVTEGTGAQPTQNDTVTVNYAGTLIDGKEFDSSYTRGQPITFQVGNVIPGWVEALKLMKEGSVWQVYIPSDLAYGKDGAAPVIGPNQTLVFKVELIKVNKQ